MGKVNKSITFTLELLLVRDELNASLRDRSRVIHAFMSLLKFIFKLALCISVRNILYHGVGSHVKPVFDKLDLLFGDRRLLIRFHTFQAQS